MGISLLLFLFQQTDSLRYVNVDQLLDGWQRY